MNYRYGNGSIKILGTVNRYLRMTAFAVIEDSVIDISIAPWGGARSAEYQNELFDKKWSGADGYKIKSDHQLEDDEGLSKALDLCAFVKGKQNWNKERLIYIGMLFLFTFNRLKKEGKIPKGVYLNCGMFWKPTKKDPDGMGWDKPHYSISNKPQVVSKKL